MLIKDIQLNYGGVIALMILIWKMSDKTGKLIIKR